ncbi:class I SAM-dependent methyltransferase [Methylobacterium longum]|uniref:Methyltransferase domain-containing protein n=1 Tax=Methylobacterium longum TaxID=767694 RepID=A0ABT8AW12_9HYPH|nr:methyltransferase domain-containing protein [Methylobacterium longum]MDN3573601.1 methyltransferase domain-containing protein [Methylobacterium longum]GJE13295.1 Ubiquinone biosynthesis O-methyltransferase, mitochondrial [Methylobacterium longum]
MDRVQQLLRSLTKKDRIIEVGPSFRPIAPKRDGWNTFVIDHASRDDLLKKYHDQTVEQIEEVDFVWTGGSLADAVPEDQHGTFDAFIASHVIEHTTDIVTFLRAAETLLRPDGIIILAVPDKRKCFDFFRYPSATAEAITAFLERRDRHTVRTHIDYALNMALKSGTEGAWAGDDLRRAELVCSPAAEPHWRATAQLPGYTDAHAWVFVPASFSLMILELTLLGYLNLRIEDMLEMYATEFFVWLRKGALSLTAEEVRSERTNLMERIIVELAEQSRQLPDSPLSKSVSENTLRNQLLTASYQAEAIRTVLSAVRASTGRFGLNRTKFRRQIAQASRKVPDNAFAAVQHQSLLIESRKVLERRSESMTTPNESAIVEVGRSDALLVVPLSAAQFGFPLFATELAREKQRSRALQTVLHAVLASLRSRALNKKKFKSIITEAAQNTSSVGPEAAQHLVLLAETQKVLGIAWDTSA